MNTSSATPILDRLSALGDETRTRILALLERSEMTVSELCAVLQLPQPNVSRHLKTLTSEGWIAARSEGRSRHYRLSDALDGAARELWAIVRAEVSGSAPFTADAARAVAVLDDRRRRSAAFFAEAAERWDELRAELFGASSLTAPLFGLLDARWTVGDLGAGTGALGASLAPFVARVVGVDRSREMLDAARIRLEPHGNVELRQGELEDLPIEDGELDLAFLALVLHYVVDPPAVLREALRALRPGGRLVLVDMTEHTGGAPYLEEMGHVWPGFEPRRIETWLAEAGFERVRSTVPNPDLGASGPPLFLASAVRPSSGHSS